MLVYVLDFLCCQGEIKLLSRLLHSEGASRLGSNLIPADPCPNVRLVCLPEVLREVCERGGQVQAWRRDVLDEYGLRAERRGHGRGAPGLRRRGEARDRHRPALFLRGPRALVLAPQPGLHRRAGATSSGTAPLPQSRSTESRTSPLAIGVPSRCWSTPSGQDAPAPLKAAAAPACATAHQYNTKQVFVYNCDDKVRSEKTVPRRKLHFL